MRSVSRGWKDRERKVTILNGKKMWNRHLFFSNKRSDTLRQYGHLAKHVVICSHLIQYVFSSIKVHYRIMTPLFPFLLRDFLQVRCKHLMNVYVITEYHRILKLDVIAEIIQTKLILLEKTKWFSDFLRCSMLAFFLLSLSFPIENFFFTPFHVVPCKHFYHNFYKVLLQSCFPKSA